MAKRNYPNNYFAWYNDDDRLAIVCQDSGGSSCSIAGYSNKSDCEGAVGTWNVGGTTSKEKYDTYQDADVTNGIRITYRAKYEEVISVDDDLKENAGLDSGMHNAVLCYVKSRLYEDDEDLEYSQYYRTMYEQQIKKFRSRRSGVRHLAVPKL